MAIDKYSDAPAMHVAHEHRVMNMLDANELRKVVHEFNPDYIVPEIESHRNRYAIGIRKKASMLFQQQRQSSLQ